MARNQQPVDERILKSIQGAKGDSVFTPRRFESFGNPAAVRQALSRLVKAGKIRRIRQGLYDLPRQHPIIGETAPDIMATVEALMEGSQAEWLFSGAFAANLMGLSEQVPAKIVILTNSGPRRVSLGKLTLIFRRAAPRNLLAAGRPAGLVIQALRYLRGSPETSTQIALLKKRVDAKTKADLKSLIPDMPAWMRPVVQQIVQK
jgi:hypothetical protein